MTEQALRWAGAALAFAGVALSAYLLYVRQTGSLLACTSGGCEAVQSSRYAEIVGLPVAGYGLFGYATLLALTSMRGGRAPLLQAVVALSAFAFSTYLLFVQVHLIDALCDWCLASDLLTTLLAVAALLRLHVAGASAREKAATR